MLALAALVGFASCDDDKTENPANVTISVAPQTLTLSLADSSPKKVVVTTDASSWTAVPDNEWVKVCLLYTSQGLRDMGVRFWGLFAARAERVVPKCRIIGPGSRLGSRLYGRRSR